MDSVKTLLYNNPSAGLGTSLGGFLISSHSIASSLGNSFIKKYFVYIFLIFDLFY